MTKETTVKETGTKIEKDTKTIKSKVAATAKKAVNFVGQHKIEFIEGTVIAGVIGIGLYLNYNNNSENVDDKTKANENEEAIENDTDDSVLTDQNVDFPMHSDSVDDDTDNDNND